MTDAAAIVIDGVSKSYVVFDNQRDRLRHALWPSRDAELSRITALRDVSFEVARGSAVGIIGRNGSGKSTLLEIITGTLQPSSGRVEVNGRVAALLELGSGFNPEYTGRENVFLNGLLLGLSRGDIEQRFDDIVGFADIGGVLDRPVKTYSSGMLVRLAFSVQIALQPDILIVDEALSVGDYFFQQKCFGRLRRMREDGLTLLFVSHDMGTVRDICSRAVYLRQGRVAFVGDAKTAISHYFAEDNPAPALGQDECPEGAAGPVPSGAVRLPSECLWQATESKEAGILAVRTVDAQGRVALGVTMGDLMRIEVYFRNPEQAGATVTLALMNRYEQVVFATNARCLDVPDCMTDGAWGLLSFDLRMVLEAGLYSLRVSLSIPYGANTGQPVDATDWLGPIQINWNYETDTAPFLGMFGLPARARLNSASPSPSADFPLAPIHE